MFTSIGHTRTGVENTKRYTKVSRNKQTSISWSSENVSEDHDVLVFDESHLLCSVLCSQHLSGTLPFISKRTVV